MKQQKIDEYDFRIKIYVESLDGEQVYEQVTALAKDECHAVIDAINDAIKRYYDNKMINEIESRYQYGI